MAPTLDPSLIQFYAGYSQDPATIVYYAQMALYYQQQGYTGQPGQAPPGGAPGAPAGGPAPPQGHDPNAAMAAQQYQNVNSYGTPTQASYGQAAPNAYAGAPAAGGYGSPYNPQQQPPQHSPPPRHDAYDDRSRQGRGSYANMPPPAGL